MSLDSAQYILNTSNGRWFAATDALRKHALREKHLVPCDEHGHRIGSDDVGAESAQLQARIAELEHRNLDLETENQLLRQELGKKGPKAVPDSITLQSKESDAPGPQSTEAQAAGAGSEATRVQQIMAAIARLEVGNPDHFNKDGTPSVDYLRTMDECQLEPAITVEERNEAWKLYSEGA